MTVSMAISAISITIASIASMAITSIAISMAKSIACFSISRPLAICTVSMTIASITNMAISAIAVSRFSYGSRFSLSISRPLAVSVVAMTISIAEAVSMAISTVISTAVSRLSHDHSEEGERENSQKFHVVRPSFSETLLQLTLRDGTTVLTID